MKQNYLINGQIAYRPVTSVIVQLGAEGNFGKSYRQNADPRPKVDDYKYKVFLKSDINGNNTACLLKEDTLII